MSVLIYLDNAATTKPCDAAKAGVMKGLEVFGNPSSLHRCGLDAELLVTDARTAVADSLGCLNEEIFFTSGATESSNTAIFGAFKSQGKRKHRVVTTTVEHPATARPFDELERLGCEVVRVSPDENGIISAEAITDAVNEDTFLVSMMLVNNETGAILPVSKAFTAIHRRFPKVITHCDCVQGYMKLPIKAKTLGADLISLSAHKICGPKGIGALYVRKGLHIPALLMGGGQEKNMRSGTESVPLICGFGEAVKQYSGNISERLEKARRLEALLFELCEKNGGISVNYRGEKSPYVNSISVEGLKSEVLLHYLEKREIFVSSGSACSKGKKSGTLAEFRIPVRNMDTTLRISFSPDTTEDDLYGLMEGIAAAQQELAKLK
ncbi:cysteine desulfurase family protein [uncultured Ruminococcus sp.]|uniref:cysteine desulfurase family protein n=1 Tax=uncultured Ruminococcus sp. TaxID=165186 RepID=UPI0025DBC43B|nr:cysteine desulfurase family protein [uncultured Ruminococcus sp.]